MFPHESSGASFSLLFSTPECIISHFFHQKNQVSVTHCHLDLHHGFKCQRDPHWWREMYQTGATLLLFKFFFSFLVQISYSSGKCARSESWWSGSQSSGKLVRSMIAHWVISVVNIIDYKETASKAWFCSFFTRYQLRSLPTLVCLLQENSPIHVVLFNAFSPFLPATRRLSFPQCLISHQHKSFDNEWQGMIIVFRLP